MKKVDIIIGVRPDIIQASVLQQTLQDYGESVDIRFIYTGQHYDPELSLNLVEDLKLQPFYAYLDTERLDGIGKISSIMMSYENQILIDPPHLVVVLGNSDSAMACSMVAARRGIRVAHIDAGLRGFDSTLVEEQNDMLIDRLSTYLFTSNEESVINLIREGYDSTQMFEMGSLRADAVFLNLGFAEDSQVLTRYGLEEHSYIVCTLHHDYVLKNREFLIALFMMFEELSEQLRIYFLLHPKTIAVLEDTPEILLDATDNLQFISSQNYYDTLKLMKSASLVLTDSQGIQEETSVLGVQCLTLGHFSNRPITLKKGTNTLMGYDVPFIREKIVSIIEGDRLDGYPIEGWDGKASQRFAKNLIEMTQ